MLQGLMMDRPLLISGLIDYAAEVHGDTQIVSASVEGGIHRTTYAEAHRRIARLANALVGLGVRPGDRVATLAWNGYRHLELYYAISGIGAVCHTINPRLPAAQLSYVVRHAGDVLLFFDATFAPIVAALAAGLPPGLRLVSMTDAARAPKAPGLPDALVYEDLLAGQPELIAWPELPETTAAALCYTSGTTGDPKGVLYSHRSSVLHALGVIAAGSEGLRPGRTILPVVPLFHVNAWGLPFAAPIVGAGMVMPGARLDGASVFELMDSERVTSAWGVPTVWMGLLAEMKSRGRKPDGLEEVIIGGSAAPGAMIAAFESAGVDVIHGWGMTEMSPVGTLCTLPPRLKALPTAQRVAAKLAQGRRIYGVDLKIVDEAGAPLPHDGIASGELHVRGPAVTSGYFNDPAASAKAFDRKGWFATGDVARITPDGFLQLVDRSKDLIKSGGEWISSIDVENAAVALPGIAMCAVIGVPSERWGERPLLVVVPAPGERPTKEAILAGLSTVLTRWQLPDDVVFVDALPMTATGKVSKRHLREQLAAARKPA